RLPQGYKIHQPPRETRETREPREPREIRSRNPRTPRSPIIIADSSPGESTPFIELPASGLPQEPEAEPARASEARAGKGGKPLDPSKNTLPSRKSPIGGPSSTFRVVFLAATISAITSSIVFVVAYMLLLRGH